MKNEIEYSFRASNALGKLPILGQNPGHYGLREN